MEAGEEEGFFSGLRGRGQPCARGGV